MAIRFTSDPKKAKLNAQKHKLTFKTGEQVFSDPFVLIIEDCTDPVTHEMRYHAMGRALSQAVLTVTFVQRIEEIHIISVRKADDYEKSAYADQFA